jgi:hypothetical protein
MDCGDMSSGGCDDVEASAFSDDEGFGGEVEARRLSHVRFSSCNLESLVSSLLVACSYRNIDGHTVQVLPPTAAISRCFVYSSDSAS